MGTIRIIDHEDIYSGEGKRSIIEYKFDRPMIISFPDVASKQYVNDIVFYLMATAKDEGREKDYRYYVLGKNIIIDRGDISDELYQERLQAAIKHIGEST